MLPSTSECIRRIQAFTRNARFSYFSRWWDRKQTVELGGKSILDDDVLVDTATELRKFLIGFGMQSTRLADIPTITTKLASIRTDYMKIRETRLGQGSIQTIRETLLKILRSLNGITNLKDYPNGNFSSITGKTKILMAIWGEVPGLDSVTRSNFLNQGRGFDAERLPWLERSRRVYSYSDNEIVDIIQSLDCWVKEWPNQNNGQRFQDLEPQTPQGRIIDKIYYQKRPTKRNKTSLFGESTLDTFNNGEEYIWVDDEVRRILRSHTEGRDLTENDVLRILLGLASLPAGKEPVDPSTADLKTPSLTLPEYHEMLKKKKKAMLKESPEWYWWKPKALIMPDGTNYAVKPFDGPGRPGYPHEGWPVIPYIVFQDFCGKGKITAGNAGLKKGTGKKNILTSTNLIAIENQKLSANKYVTLPDKHKTKVYMTGIGGGPVSQTGNAIRLIEHVGEDPWKCRVVL